MSLIHNANVVRDGLVLYLDAANPKSYPGSGTTWYDLSGNGNHGTLTNGPTYNSDNKGSIVFDGSDDRTNFGNKSTFNFTGAEDVSIIAWIKPSLPTRFDGVILGKIGYTLNKGWMFSITDYSGGTSPYLFMTYGTNTRASSKTLPASIYSQWIFVAVTSKYQGQLLLYFNGLPLTGYTPATIDTTVLSPSGIEMWAGQRIDSSDRVYKGNMSVIQIYNRALSAAEIAQNFEATRGRYSI